MTATELRLGTALVEFPKGIDRFPTSDLYERLGEPNLEAVIRIDGNPLSEGVPAIVYVPGWFGACSDNMILVEEKIIINNFGESFNPHKTILSSSHLRPGSLISPSILPPTFGYLSILSGRPLASGLCLRFLPYILYRVNRNQIYHLHIKILCRAQLEVKSLA